jgi:hypothetical protein
MKNIDAVSKTNSNKEPIDIKSNVIIVIVFAVVCAGESITDGLISWIL